MCVIIHCEKNRPTEQLILSAASSNPHGMGIAWHEKGAIHWRKGIDINSLTDLALTVKLPFVMHFRIATVGAVGADLCHPFPVNASGLGIQGVRKSGGVLFHNGHWVEWQDCLLKSLTSDGHSHVPEGELSDSRAMAILAHRHGARILELIPKSQRIVHYARVNGKLRVTRYGDGWTNANGIWLSNTRFLSGESCDPRKSNSSNTSKRSGYSRWLPNSWRLSDDSTRDTTRSWREEQPSLIGENSITEVEGEEVIEAFDERSGEPVEFKRSRTTWGGMPTVREHKRR